MKVLLDTHIFIYYVNSDRISKAIRNSILTAEQVLVSAITSWEVFMLVKHKFINLNQSPLSWYNLALLNFSFQEIAITSEVSLEAVNLDWEYRDPADRWIIASAIRNGAILLTRDKKIINSGLVKTIN